jgi:hypothetical protein
MTKNEDLKRLYTGSEINVNVLKEILDDNQIPSLIKNDLKSGLTAGFGGGYAEAESSIFVFDINLEKAKAILDEFLNSFD